MLYELGLESPVNLIVSHYWEKRIEKRAIFEIFEISMKSLSSLKALSFLKCFGIF